MINDKKMNVITICSGKGGVGKSFLAANIGYSLANGENKVLIWDADLFFPNQHIIFGVEPTVRLADVYQNKNTLENAYFQINNNLTLLADSPAESKKEKVKPSILHDVFTEINESQMFDLLIIDTPASGLKEIIQCCSFADTIAVTINDEPTSLLDAYGLIKVLCEYFTPEKIKLIVNNVIDFEDAIEFSGKLNLATQKFLKIEFDSIGYVPYDRLIKQSIIKQEIFVKNNSNSDTTFAIKEIGNKIINHFEQVEYLIGS